MTILCCIVLKQVFKRVKMQTFFDFSEGISGQVYKGTYYGIPVAVKEISDEEEFKHEEEIIFGDQLLHPSITM